MFTSLPVTVHPGRRAALAASFALASLLSACGGGGNGPDRQPAPPVVSPPPPPPPVQRGPLYDFTPIGLPGMSLGAVVRQGIANGGLVAGTAWVGSEARAFLFDGEKSIDLGTLGGGSARAFSVNRCGQVAGWAYTASGIPHAFLYNGSMRDLGTLGGADSYGNVISTCGKVAGWAGTSGGQGHAFYHDGKTMRDLGTFGGNASSATAINSLGQVVGNAYLADSTYHAFLYDARTGAPILDIGPPGWRSTAVDINEAGQVAISAVGATTLRAYRYAGGTLLDLGLPPGARDTEATAINAAGHVVGTVTYPDDRKVAFLHDGNTLHELGTLGGGRISQAVAVNASGLVVGSSVDPTAVGQRAFAWSSSYGMVNLNERVKDLPKDVTLLAALAVADDGAIVVRTTEGLGLLRPRK